MVPKTLIFAKTGIFAGPLTPKQRDAVNIICGAFLLRSRRRKWYVKIFDCLRPIDDPSPD